MAKKHVHHKLCLMDWGQSRLPTTGYGQQWWWLRPNATCADCMIIIFGGLTILWTTMMTIQAATCAEYMIIIIFGGYVQQRWWSRPSYLCWVHDSWLHIDRPWCQLSSSACFCHLFAMTVSLRLSPITLICHFFQNFNDSNHLLLSLFQMIFSVILITFVTCLGWMTVFVCHYFCFKFHSSLVAIYWTSSTIYWTSSTDKLFLASRHPLMILLPLYGRVKKNYMSVLHNFLNFHPA